MAENFIQRKINLVLLTYYEFLQKKIAEDNWTKNDGTIAGQLHRDRSQNNQTWDKNGR